MTCNENTPHQCCNGHFLQRKEKGWSTENRGEGGKEKLGKLNPPWRGSPAENGAPRVEQWTGVDRRDGDNDIRSAQPFDCLQPVRPGCLYLGTYRYGQTCQY